MNLLVLVHPSKSHINALRKPLRVLKNEGHSITICSSRPDPKTFKELGIDFYFLKSMPFGSGFEGLINRGRKHRHLENYMMRFSDYFFKKRKTGIIKLLKEVNPDVVLVDILYATDAYLLHTLKENRQMRVFYFSTKASLDRTITTPPINCYEIPRSKEQVAKLWSGYNTRQFWKEIKEGIQYLFHDDHSILKEKIKKDTTFLQDYPLINKDFVGRKFGNIPILMLIPKEFEFQPISPNKDQHYIGFQFDERQEFPQDFEHYETIEGLLLQQQNLSRKVVYCSFGSLYQIYEKEVFYFLEQLVKTAKSLPQIEFIISYKNTSLKQTEIKQVPENVHFFDYVPQLKVLENADVFITHGGINSIKEAIHFETPLLVYPLNPNWDQPGNSARIEYHQLGLRGQILRDKPEDITIKLQHVLHSPEYRENIRAFNAISQHYPPELFLDTFYQLTAAKAVHSI